ncbi:hypothetical protein G9C98_002126 [Cotesia typhae]|uniref:Uncharacterized protein n=1 Tax=Cotesia typhae TaxID=2053667 RepID=A0A8J5R8D4_9HYME|nr:hypothetical protein G9C98_002126 [Cotesia typhae]
MVVEAPTKVVISSEGPSGNLEKKKKTERPGF